MNTYIVFLDIPDDMYDNLDDDTDDHDNDMYDVPEDVRNHDDEVVSSLVSHIFAKACEAGKLDMIQYMVEQGATPKSANHLREAIRMGHKDVVEYLLGHGSRCVVEMNDFRYLFSESYNGVHITSLLFEYGMVPDIWVKQCLHRYYKGFADAYECFREAGIKCDSPTTYKRKCYAMRDSLRELYREWLAYKSETLEFLKMASDTHFGIRDAMKNVESFLFRVQA